MNQLPVTDQTPLPGAVLAGILDDAAVFPPGELPLAQALPAHLQHRRGAHAALVGPFVLAAPDLPALTELVADLEPRAFDLTLTTRLPAATAAVVGADGVAAAQLVAIEVALPDDAAPSDVVPHLDRAVGDRPEVTVFVEVPRDERRDAVLAALARSRHLAKFRTGGVRAELYPDETELARSVLAAVRAGVAFKATAGLHHALRNTDPTTGFEQHGFLNLLVATDAAVRGADEATLVALLAERSASRIVDAVRATSAEARGWFHSFGTCSIAEPVEELAQLGLLSSELTQDLP